jgi:hypothetical protein
LVKRYSKSVISSVQSYFSGNFRDALAGLSVLDIDKIY